MTERSHWLALERFDYSPLAGRWGVARMLSSLTDDLGVPGQAQLVIERAGSTVTRHGSFVSAVDRRGGELLWVASFALPLDIVSCEDAVFGLWTPGRAHVALPAPGTVMLPAGARAELRLARRFPRLHFGRRATAMATAVALGVTSLPTTGLALASGDQALVHRTPADQDPTTAAQNSVGPVAHIAVPGKPAVKLNAAPAQPAAP